MRKVISIIKNAFIQFTMYEEHHHSVIECMAKNLQKKRGKDYDKAELSSTKKEENPSTHAWKYSFENFLYF